MNEFPEEWNIVGGGGERKKGWARGGRVVGAWWDLSLSVQSIDCALMRPVRNRAVQL